MVVEDSNEEQDTLIDDAPSSDPPLMPPRASSSSHAEEAPAQQRQYVEDDPNYFAQWDYDEGDNEAPPPSAVAPPPPPQNEESNGVAPLPPPAPPTQKRQSPEESFAVRRRGRLISFHETILTAVRPGSSTSSAECFSDVETPSRLGAKSATSVRVKWTEHDAFANALVRRFELSEKDPEALPPAMGLAEGDYLHLVKAGDGFELNDEAIATDADLHAAVDRAEIWPYQRRLEAVACALAKLRVGHDAGRVELKIRRKQAFKGGFKAYKQLQLKGWRMSWFVKFHQEIGLDAGGLSREFWRLTMCQAFSDKFGLFKRSEGGGNTTYDVADGPIGDGTGGSLSAVTRTQSSLSDEHPLQGVVEDDAKEGTGRRPSGSGDDDEHGSSPRRDSAVVAPPQQPLAKLRLDEYRFVGRGLGKMLFDAHGGCLDASPNVKLLKLLVGEPLVFDDLQLIDESLWLSLSKLKTMPDDDLRSLALTFSVSQFDPVTKAARTFELCDRGDDRAVHKGNLDEFLEARLRHAIFPPNQRAQLTALLAGFHDVVPPSVMLLLTARELELALCGLPKIDVADFRANTVYKGEFAADKENHPVCAAFWTTVAAWDDEKRGRLLQCVRFLRHVTSSPGGPRVPPSSPSAASATSSSATASSACSPSPPSTSTSPSTPEPTRACLARFVSSYVSQLL